MDGYRGPATLEWWANGSLCLGAVDVRVTVRDAGSAWACDAIFDAEQLSPDEREVFELCMASDPLFTLRLGDGSTLLVDAVVAGEAGHLALTSCDPAGPAG
ncbi:hypothetical protein OG689_38680 [Kitasatospora sp. NBC_00240]|uniref:hypothetical protein n=1 Tax=Kitasatospora sp. NBC_00240 TaxID=2903567 RepID=UPI00225A67B0|nr:hypothetical protein [Kitasatospora sp. NBC_00240]MCX5215123.1 hypothetical protein [Kitasatospora sp. NBC_00240]